MGQDSKSVELQFVSPSFERTIRGAEALEDTAGQVETEFGRVGVFKQTIRRACVEGGDEIDKVLAGAQNDRYGDTNISPAVFVGVGEFQLMRQELPAPERKVRLFGQVCQQGAFDICGARGGADGSGIRAVGDQLRAI